MWYDVWADGTSKFPTVDATNIESVFYEVECTSLGSEWQILKDDTASNGAYAVINAGLNSPNEAPNRGEGMLQIPFTVSRNESYYVFARVNCPTSNDDSFWIKIDDGEFTTANGLRTTGWDWVKLTKTGLHAGKHTLTIAYREDGAAIDKVGITTYLYGPTELGSPAENTCLP